MKDCLLPTAITGNTLSIFWLCLSLLTACTSAPQRLASTPVFAVCPVLERILTEKVTLAQPQLQCVQDKSIYSPLVWLPFFGPLYDAATNTHAEHQLSLSLLSTLLPGIGPAIQTGVGARQCLAQCLPQESISNLPISGVKHFLTLALDVSDRNCQHFLDNLPTALNANNAYTPELTPLLMDTIRTERQLARQNLSSLMLDATAITSKINAYDTLCSVDHALALLSDASHNQLSGNNNSNGLDRKVWL